MNRAWFVTSALQPDIPLDGPFVSYDECAKRCVTRVDRLTALRAFVERRIPAIYIPHLFEVQLAEVRHLYSAQDAHEAPPKRAASSGGRGEAVLPPVVYTYTRGDLVALCRSLEIRPPPSGADKAGIIEHIEKQLRRLERGARG